MFLRPSCKFRAAARPNTHSCARRKDTQPMTVRNQSCPGRAGRALTLLSLSGLGRSRPSRPPRREHCRSRRLSLASPSLGTGVGAQSATQASRCDQQVRELLFGTSIRRWRRIISTARCLRSPTRSIRVYPRTDLSCLHLGQRSSDTPRSCVTDWISLRKPLCEPQP